MTELYVVGAYRDGDFTGYVRKGRSFSIVAYDSLVSAKKGIAHTRREKEGKPNITFKILKADSLTEVKE